MSNEEFNIKFGATKSPTFRKKREDTIEIPPLLFSEEKDNDRDLGAKRIDLFVKDSKEEIGSIHFDYPKEDAEKLLKVRLVALADKYRGHNLAIKLFEQLLSLAKEEGLEGIESDETVQGGAMIIVKELKDRGYDISLHPKVQNKYDEFMKKYEKGKYFKEPLKAPIGESVFKVYLKEK